MNEQLIIELQQAQERLVQAQGAFLAAATEEGSSRVMRFAAEPVAPETVAAVRALTDRLMTITELGTTDRLVAGAALQRCVAGFYARLAADHHEPPVLASVAVLIAMTPTAELARELAEAHLAGQH